jgi:NADPH2:quinone reductase
MLRQKQSNSAGETRVRAVICHEFGPIEALSVADMPDPVAQAGEVVIAVEAAGVNFPDGLMVRGEYQVKPPRPFTPGSEVAGRVAGLGAGVDGFAVGDRVVALCSIGGFAERVAVSADRVLHLPDGMEARIAAGFMLVYGTSMHALADKARIVAGETLLVLGAAGGVGLAAVEIGRALGARVIAAASTDEKCALAAAHGAALTINYGAADLKTELKRLVPGGVDVVYDPVGGALTEAAVRGMAWGGRLLVVGFANGEIPKLPLNLLLLREGEAVGVFWGAFTQRDPARHARNVETLMQWFAEGKLKPHIGGAYGLNEVHTALGDVMGRRAQGKIVLTP